MAWLCGKKFQKEKRHCDRDKCIGHIDKNTQRVDRIYIPNHSTQVIVQVDK